MSVNDVLNGIAATAGMNVADSGGMPLPQIRIGQDLLEFSKRVGNLCERLEIFFHNDAVVYFDYAGELKTMTPDRFRTWLLNHAVTFKRMVKQEIPGGESEQVPIACSMKKDEASVVLSAEPFLSKLRKISAVASVRLPIRRAAGEIELLPLGYDYESAIYTNKQAVEYDTEMQLPVAKGWIQRYFGAFPFQDDRSRAVLVTSLLAMYVRNLFPKGTLRPGFVFLANKPGSGKSVLAKASIYPVLGHAAAAKMKKDAELDKELEAFAIHGVPYIFLDNVYHSIQSASLDQMLTSTHSQGRAMGGHGIFVAENSAQIFVTGNDLQLNDDAQRRFLIVDLFEKGDPKDRIVENPIGDKLMQTDAFRAEALAVLWALVKNWNEKECPQGDVILPTYEEFSHIMGGIVTAAGYDNPMQRASVLDDINPEKKEFALLLSVIIQEMGDDLEREWTAQELSMYARLNGLLEEKVGTLDEGLQETIRVLKPSGEDRARVTDQGYMNKSQGSKFGKFLKKQVGSQFTIGERLVTFGKRSQSNKSHYTVALD